MLQCTPVTGCFSSIVLILRQVNLLFLDSLHQQLREKRVIACREEERLIRTLTGWGFEPIPCSFYDFETIGGWFHCASVDIRRRGGLQSYF